MAMSINTNISSLTTQGHLTNTQNALGKSMERLSSGLRINSASDDAAGMSIANRMTAQVRGMDQAVRNANDGVSMAQTAEGGMAEIGDMLQRMRELVVQGANETNDVDDLAAITTEIGELNAEIDRLAGATSFNGKTLLDGALDVDLQVGANATADDTINLSIAQDFTSVGLGTDALAVTDNAAAQTSITALDDAIKTVDTERGKVGSMVNRLDHTVKNLTSQSQNMSAARSRIQDADIASESALMTRSNVLQQAGVSILAQANQSPNVALSLLGG
nr:flagellin [uncultured Desulfuromonas sp.]